MLMAKRSSKERQRDCNILAKYIGDVASGQNSRQYVGEKQVDTDKNPKGIEADLLGGVKSGKAPVERLTASERQAIPKKTARTPWQKAAEQTS